MGLTQVMLQVKGCEMVCKQRELIPKLRRLSPAGTEPNSYLPPPPFFASIHSFSSSHACPVCQIVSDSVQQRLSGAIKKVPKHRGKCRLLTKMRLDQDQYGFPLLPNTRAHPSTNTITDEPQHQLNDKAWLHGEPDPCHTEAGLILQKHCFWKTGMGLTADAQIYCEIKCRQHLMLLKDQMFD